MQYIYARVSTQKQDLQRQIDMLKKKCPDAVVVSEKYTGTKIDRPEWKKLKKKLKSGDTVVFESVDRLSRSAEEGAAIYAELFEMGVELVFLKNPNIDTSVYREQIARRVEIASNTEDATGKFIDGLGKLLNEFIKDLAKEQVRLAFSKAEEEAMKTRQRTKEGIQIAKANGKQIGRITGKRYVTKKELECREKIQKHAKCFGGSLSDAEVIELCKINRNTYYRYKARMIEEINRK